MGKGVGLVVAAAFVSTFFLAAECIARPELPFLARMSGGTRQSEVAMSYEYAEAPCLQAFTVRC